MTTPQDKVPDASERRSRALARLESTGNVDAVARAFNISPDELNVWAAEASGNERTSSSDRVPINGITGQKSAAKLRFLNDTIHTGNVNRKLSPATGLRRRLLIAIALLFAGLLAMYLQFMWRTTPSRGNAMWFSAADVAAWTPVGAEVEACPRIGPGEIPKCKRFVVVKKSAFGFGGAHGEFFSYDNVSAIEYPLPLADRAKNAAWRALAGPFVVLAMAIGSER
jgi:hypothetical protein